MKQTIKLVLAILFLSLTFNLVFQNPIKKVEAQQQIGFFEGEVPIFGAYLRAINCVPGYGSDKDGDGVYDKGYTRDFDGDGIEETHYVEDPLIVDLAANGFFPGDRVMITHKTSINHDGNFEADHVYGLFSSTSELLTEEYVYDPGNGGKKWPTVGPLNRVPGAIDARLAGYKPNTNNLDVTYGQGPMTAGQGEISNDIPEDFYATKEAYNIGYVPPWEGGSPGEWDPNKYRLGTGLWMTVPPEAKYLFFQVQTPWNIYKTGGYSIVTIDKDSDKDAIPDSWEENGIDFNKDGLLDLILEDANFMKKDLYVEVDYMGSSGTCLGHDPFTSEVLPNVQTAFENAPAQSVKNPDSSAGIILHIDGFEADEIPHQDVIKAFDDVQNLRSTYFGTADERGDSNSVWIRRAKRFVFRYAIFAHQFSLFKSSSGTWEAQTSSGIAESPNGCNDFIVTLGGFPSNPGTVDEQAATFMHELGHALGLHHGGDDNINYKPNYLSIMNYLFQFDTKVSSRPLDYSRMKLDTLNEDALDELKGLGVNQIDTYDKPWIQTAFSVRQLDNSRKLQVTYLMPIDWNNDTEIENDQLANLNSYPQWQYDSPLSENLVGWDDWTNLDFYFQELDSYTSGADPEEMTSEITWEIAQEIKTAIEESTIAIPEFSSPLFLTLSITLSLVILFIFKGWLDRE
ncbi:MAG: hypothetical protein P8X91_03015 [Candidatus Bathyarchaeota archaeon]